MPTTPNKTTKSQPRLLHPKKTKRQRSNIDGILRGWFFGTTCNDGKQITQSLQQAEDSERQQQHIIISEVKSHDNNNNSDNDNVAMQHATGIPVVKMTNTAPQQQSEIHPTTTTTSSGSSSWSSTPAEVPYINAGHASGSLKQQRHAIPSPSYLAAVQHFPPSKERHSLQMVVPPSLQAASFISSDETLASWRHFSSSQSRIEAKTQPSPSPRILQPRESKFQQFWDELKDLIQDLLQYTKAKTWKKKVLTVSLCCCSILVFYDLFFGSLIVQWLQAFILWMTQHSAMAVLAFVVIFVVATLMFIPPTLLVFGAGYAFTVALDSLWMGILAATISCFLGSAVGAVIAFLRARYMMRDLVYLFSKRYPLVRVADRCLKTNGFHIMVLLRMCPLLPFNGLNYICGITGVSLQDFCTSLIGILPFYVYTVILGATAGQLRMEYPNTTHGKQQQQDNNNQKQHITFIVLICSGVIFGLIAMVYTWRLVKAELKKELQLSSEEFETLVHGGNIETTIRSNRNRVTTILSYDPEAENDEAVIMTSTESRSMPATAASPNNTPSDYHLQQEQHDNEDDAVETKLMEDGEEWFWVWA